jgi:hypothetical protein
MILPVQTLRNLVATLAEHDLKTPSSGDGVRRRTIYVVTSFI